MAVNSTQITIVGNLTSDPELRFTPSGIAVTKITVAVNRKSYDQTSQTWQDNGTDFYYVSAWRSLAENVASSLQKGDRVIACGTLESSVYETKTGEKRTAWNITAQAVGPDLLFACADVSKSVVRESRKGEGGPKPTGWETPNVTPKVAPGDPVVRESRKGEGVAKPRRRQ